VAASRRTSQTTLEPSRQEGDAQPREGSPTPSGPSRRQLFDTKLLPALYLAPAFVFIFGLTVWPVLQTFRLSLTGADLRSLMTGEHEFVGLENFATIVTDGHLRVVFLQTALFGLACVLATMVLGMAVALLLNQRFRGHTLVGVLVLLPWAVPAVAGSIVWQWMFHDQYGIVNWSLASVGLVGFDGFPWFNDRYTAFFAIGVVVVWQGFPFVALCLLAGLKSVSGEVLEAAKVDGAGPWQTVRLIIMPILKPLILVLIVISTIWNFKIFDQVYVMTRGGPARATEVLAITTWREAFTQHDFGLAAALAVAMFLILAVITALYLWLIRDDEEFG
jgi:ABC-type sugar transport system permease subunit